MPAIALRLKRFAQDDRGADALEYALVAAGLLVVVFGAYSFLGNAAGTFIRSLPGLLGFGG